MKNKEKYDLNEISISVQGDHVGLIAKANDQKVFEAITPSYNETFRHLLKWLDEETGEEIKLTNDEIVILKNIDKKFKDIARFANNGLYLSERKGELKPMGQYNHLFSFIKEHDRYPIDELLKQNGVVR